MVSLNSIDAFISVSARFLLNRVKSSHSCSVVELWGVWDGHLVSVHIL